MEVKKKNRKIYKKAVNLFVGEAYDELQDENVLSKFRMKIAYNSGYLLQFLQRNPKVVVVKSFGDIEKNSMILNTIINSCPKCKILLIGGDFDQYKKNIAEKVDIFLPDETNFEAFKTAFESLLYNYNYGEDINGSVLEFRGMNPIVAKIICLGAILTFFILSTFLYFLIE